MRILWVHSNDHFGPYHHAMFSAAVKYIPDFSILVTALNYTPSLHEWDSDCKKFPCSIFVARTIGETFAYIHENRPDVIAIVGGYNEYIYTLIALWAKKHAIPIILVTDQWYGTKQRSWLKEMVKSLLVRAFFSAALVPGTRSFCYAKSLGIQQENIWKFIYVIDQDHFQQHTTTWLLDSGFPEHWFLTVCRLSPEKNIANLLLAFDQYVQKGGTWGLVIAGTGPQETALKSLITEATNRKVLWAGWVSYENLPSLYQSASCFVLPSLGEPWGQVVTEAMSVGLPLLLSKKCGCVPEFCLDGFNGYTFDPFDVDHLSQLMLLISSDNIDRKSMSTFSQELAKQYTPEMFAKNLVSCAYTILQQKDIK